LQARAERSCSASARDPRPGARGLSAAAGPQQLAARVALATALYEITGDLEDGPIGVVEHGELPSAGDTSYTGVGAHPWLALRDHLVLEPSRGGPEWLVGFGGRTDIWKAELDLSLLRR
jgi:hypothetical protein